MRQVIFVVLLWTICPYAIWRGGWSERAAAIVFFAAVETTALLVSPFSHRWLGPEWAVFIIDALVLALFLMIALRSTRFWPMWLVPVQACEVISHVLLLGVPGLHRTVYANAIQLWSYPLLALIAVASWKRARDIPF